MSDKTMVKNETYRGFRVIECMPVKELDSTALWLRHERTGLEVFHLLNDDKENLFSFSFRTPSMNSTGVAHIIEHSVLCGSEKYPMKDPFLRLSQQSINTYLNAFTASDRTVYPASSVFRADYFNLMSVYADAVFFPLLREEIFLQEGWRIELNEKNEPELQGVVLNEMKGNYSSFDRVASAVFENTMVRGGCYEKDSGGDPLEIPFLTYEEFKNFHKKFYCPANCLVFLCGNIPTKDQLDFIDEHVLSKITEPGEKASVSDYCCDSEIPAFVHEMGPADTSSPDAEKKSTAGLVWKIDPEVISGDSSIATEFLFLSDLIFGSDCSPVIKRLLDEFPGCDIAPETGLDVSLRYYNMCVALRGIEEDSAARFRSCIEETLQSLYENGISRDDFERASMNFEFSNREIRRSMSGPFSITLMRRVLREWVYGRVPWNSLFMASDFAALKEKIAADEKYISSLIKKYFLDNKDSSLIVVTPSSDWTEDRIKKEKELAERIFASMGEDKTRALVDKMHAFQNSSCPDEDSLIPSIKVSDLEEIEDDIVTVRKTLGSVPVYRHVQPTNGITYMSIAMPADCLDLEDYRYISILEDCITGLGFDGLSWDQASSICEKTFGGMTAYTRCSNVPDCSKDKIEENPLEVGRYWFVINFKFLEEKTADALALAARSVSRLEFTDCKRLETLISGRFDSMVSNIVPHAHYFAMQRACRTLNRAQAVNEKLNGLSHLFDLDKVRKEETSSILSNLSRIYKKIRDSGAVINLIGTEDGLRTAESLFPEFAKELGLVPPLPKKEYRDEDFFAATEISGTEGSSAGSTGPEIFIIPGNMGFSACAVHSSSFDTKESVADEVLTHLLETSDLWKQIRTVGGAYGVFLSANPDSNVTRFLTYRDPKPFDSLEYFSGAMKNLAEKDFGAEEIEKSVTGVYSDEVRPETPLSKGSSGFWRILYGLDGGYCERKVSRLLSIKAEDIKKAALRYAKAESVGEKVVLCGNSMITEEISEKSGKITKVPLY